MHLRALKNHLSKYLLVYVLLGMGIGLAVGYPAAGFVHAHRGTFTALTTVAVFLIIYPMMVNLKMESIKLATKNWKGILIILAYNFLLAPLYGWLLAHGLLRDPMLSIGFLLVMVVPCSSMSIGYTGLAEGNVELATVAMAVSFLFSMIAVPAWMSLFAAHYSMPSPTWILIKSMLTVLIAPMIAGYLTRLALMKKLGEKKFIRLMPLFPSVSVLAMLLIVLLIFFMKESLIVKKWSLVLWLMIPNILFMAGTLFVVTWVDKLIRLSYEDHMAIVFAATGKNNGTAIALATMAFSPLVAIPAATLPIFQIMLLVAYLKVAPWIRRYFMSREVPAAASVSGTKVPGVEGNEALSPAVGEAQSSSGLAATPLEIVSARRMINTYLPTTQTLAGQTFEVTVQIEVKSKFQGLGLEERLPEGWRITPLSNASAHYYPDRHQWLFVESLVGGMTKSIIYQVHVPADALPGDYSIQGEVSSAAPAFTQVVAGAARIEIVECLPVSWVVSRWNMLGNRFDIRLGDLIGFDQIHQAMAWWLQRKPVPNTCGMVLDLKLMEKLIAYWLTQTPVFQPLPGWPRPAAQLRRRQEIASSMGTEGVSVKTKKEGGKRIVP